MSEQILKVFNITPHALVAPKQTKHLIKDAQEAVLWPVFLDKIKKRIIPQSLIDKKETDRQEFDVLGALLTALKGHDINKLYQSLVDKEYWTQEILQLMKKLISSRRLVHQIEINKPLEDIYQSEEDFVPNSLNDKVCGTICSSSLDHNFRPNKCIPSDHDITKFPAWFLATRPEKIGNTVSDWKDLLTNLLGHSIRVDYFDSYIMKRDVNDPTSKYHNFHEILSLIGRLNVQRRAEVNLHVKQSSGQILQGGSYVPRYNLQPKKINKFISYLERHKTGFTGIKSITLNCWLNEVHDRELLTDLGGCRLGIGAQEGIETGFQVLSKEYSESERLKYKSKTNFKKSPAKFFYGMKTGAPYGPTSHVLWPNGNLLGTNINKI